MGVRRKAREYAFQILFQLDFDGDNLEDKLEQFWQTNKNLNRRGLVPPQVKQFAEALVKGTIEQLDQIDTRISQHSLNWRLSRMAATDRNILRFSTYEILYCDDIPVKVSINEALDIAKKYSTTESVSFINGILDKIAHQE